MADETNKKIVSSNDASKPSATKVDDGKVAPKPRQITLANRRISKKKTVLISLLVALLAAWVIFGLLHVGQKVYAQAAGHKIYKEEVKQLIGDTKGVSDRQAATVLADKYLTEALAKEQGVTVTDKDIEAAYGKSTLQEKKDHPYSYQLSVNQVYFDKLQANNAGIYKGDLLVAHFSRFIPAQDVSAADKAGFPQLGDPAAIAADKKYAKDFITDLYNQVRAGKLTWGQAAERERTNSMLGEQMYPALSHSGAFNTSKISEPLFAPPAAQKEVKILKAGQTSKPFVVTVKTTRGVDVESYYLVIHMTSKSGGQNAGTADYLEQAKDRLGYKVYV